MLFTLKKPRFITGFLISLFWFFILATLVLSPVLFTPFPGVSVIQGKSIFLIFLTVILGILFFILLFLRKSQLPFLFLLFCIFLLSSHILSVLFSINIINSFYGSFDRAYGFLTQISAVIFFCFFCFIVSLEKINIKKYLWIFIIPFCVSATVSILQLLNFPWSAISTVFAGRIDGTFGNPNAFALYLLLISPLFLFLFKHSEKVFLKITAFALFLLSANLMILTGSRLGAILFFLQFILLLIFLKPFQFQIQKRSLFKYILSITAILFSLWLVLNINSIIHKRLIDFKIPLQSMETRLKAWDAGWKMFSERPFFGFGHENFLNALQKRKTLLSNFAYLLPDRAHNEFLDILVERGIFGLLSTLLLIFYCYFQFFKKYKTVSPVQKAFGISLFTASLSYIIFNMLNFPDQIHAVYFWIINAALLFIDQFKFSKNF